MSQSAPSLWFVPAVLALALLVLGPTLAATGLASPFGGFKVFAGSALVGVIALLLGLWLYFARDKTAGMLSLAGGLIPLSIIAFGLFQAKGVPRINDVSTDLDNPPPLTTAATAPENAGKDLSYPEEFKSEVRQGYPHLIGKKLAHPPTEAFEAVKRAAAAFPTWTVTRTDDAMMTLEGYETAGIFKFVDDFVIRVEPLESQSVVNMRSRSRVGKGDFGANAKRIERFFAALDAAGAGK